ncbi:cadherin-99C isoform X2 [Periplaneta americana]|uniref:cadherin-99C isoform X2 n=1 Tax=Periplaneta americana TaxID=6978 RepID=UPI0037E81A59
MLGVKTRMGVLILSVTILLSTVVVADTSSAWNVDRARNVSERFSTTTTLTVNIRDDDDQNPSFIYQGCMLHDGTCINPEYSASVSSGKQAGILNISPEKIQAIDMDSINAPIKYSFLSGTPSSYKDYFEINGQTGAVQQIKAVDTSVTKKFEIIVKAEEVSEQKRSATAKLFITVKPVDSNPPIINASATEGFVDENAPIGTQVVDKNGKPIRLIVTDEDLGPDDPKPSYSFELTNNYFTVDNNGYLIVKVENLDRDPPSPGYFKFQIIAREKTANAGSPPLFITVTLNDVNDNAPRLPMIPPLTIQAGEGKQTVTKVEATDADLGKNAEITYSIYHISNNGGQKFKIDPKTGVIETIGRLNAGEQYSITVQATDSGGKYSHTIVEVTVIPGPNTRGPVFDKPVYEVQVSEGASINSTVTTITAVDPENDPVTYSIISGNDLRQFAIGDKTGIITVIRKLDREDLTRYQLIIKAEDTGGLSSTATVNIKVTDINDKNPEFTDLPYVFRVPEGEANKKVGNVHAVDADEGQNAVIYYSVPEDIPFGIDAMTGEIRTKVALDYEKQREYRFVVTAKDGAPDPRLATATVTVEVVDMDDELPIFHLTSYEAQVPENMPDYIVTQVKADDPDTNQRITYVIKQGSTELFHIDPKTGIITTTRGLDYEKESQYILVVGTLENQGTGPGATTRVIVNVLDRNDIPPVFTTVPRPVTLDDDVPIGTTVTTLIATDSDGTSPGNKVRYELIGRGKAQKYFQIDPDTGVIQVRDDLRKETTTEYEIAVKAYDLGEPQLSSVTSVHVYVRHVATVPPDQGIGFADTSYTVEIPENATANTFIKSLTIINKRGQQEVFPLNCVIIKGNEEGLFYTNITEDRNCELRLKSGSLDHEKKSEYQIEIKLDTLSSLVNPTRSTATVKINVVDLNDNRPHFIFPNDKFNGKYFGAIPMDSQIGTIALHVKAEDTDSGKFGQLSYRIVPNNMGSDYFKIDRMSGIITTTNTFSNVDLNQLPFRFKVEVWDNPNSPDNSFTAEVPVVINLIGDQNRLILVIDDAKPETITHETSRLVDVMEDDTNLVIGVEKVAAKLYVGDNGTIEQDPVGTDVWFYAVDPDTDKILDRNSTRIQRSILNKDAISKITVDVTGNLRATASTIHPPLTVPKTVAAVAVSWEVFPYALIVIACIILVLGIVGIIYICISWSRYKAYKERMQRMYVVPRYDPVFVEPNLKEYETQVLQMSVPLDDSDSYNDLQLDFSSKNHAFSLDNVSYITKENGDSIGQQSPVSSDAATTARASSIAGGVDMGRGHSRGDSDHNNLMGHDPPLMPVTNPMYQRSSEEDIGHMNASATNENVTFREKKDYSHLGFTYLGDRSPVETTTEL